MPKTEADQPTADTAVPDEVIAETAATGPVEGERDALEGNASIPGERSEVAAADVPTCDGWATGDPAPTDAAIAQLSIGSTITIEPTGFTVKSGGMHWRWGQGATIEAAVYDLFNPSTLP